VVPSDDHNSVEISRLVASKRQLEGFVLVVSVRGVTEGCWLGGGLVPEVLYVVFRCPLWVVLVWAWCLGLWEDRSLYFGAHCKLTPTAFCVFEFGTVVWVWGVGRMVKGVSTGIPFVAPVLVTVPTAP